MKNVYKFDKNGKLTHVKSMGKWNDMVKSITYDDTIYYRNDKVGGWVSKDGKVLTKKLINELDMKETKIRQIIREEISKLTERIKPEYKKGDKVRMTDDTVDNYGSKYRGKVFTITHVATSTDDHPGFDDIGQALYDLKGLSFSLYDYELEPANKNYYETKENILNETLIDQLRDIVDKKQAAQVKDPTTKKRTKVDIQTANVVTQVYDMLSDAHKQKFTKLPLHKMVDVAWKATRR